MLQIARQVVKCKVVGKPQHGTLLNVVKTSPNMRGLLDS